MRILTTFLVHLALIGGTLSHSWLACTDYLHENGDYWNPAECRAYPRHGHNFTPKEDFGLDRGYDYHVQEGKVCRDSRNDNGAYTKEYPMAVYYPGQKVVIAHPTKNHVAEKCTNKYIPDNGNYIWRSPANVSSDPTYTVFKQNKVVDLGISPFGHQKTDMETQTYPKEGYQNSPKFCEDTDKALATNAFYIPPNIQPGRYTFLWTWSFNGPCDTYGTCWEADIVATKGERDAVLNSRGQSTANPLLFYGVSLATVPEGLTTRTGGGQATEAPAATQAPGKTPSTTSSGSFILPPPPLPKTLQCLDTCIKTCYSG